MVLSAHLVDVAEWLTIVFVPDWQDGHYLTHSPLAVTILLAIYLLPIITLGRLRKPWPLLLVAVAIFSHLPMDAAWTRDTLARGYAVAPAGNDGYSLKGMILAEFWFYGFVLLSVALVRGTLQPATTQTGRRAAIALLCVACAAAATRNAFIWLPVYLLGFAHASLMTRREWHPQLAWSAVFLIPLICTVSGEAYASHLLGQAWSCYLAKDYDAAISVYEKALRFPMRASPAMIYAHMGQVYEAQGKLADAEKMFLAGAAAAPGPHSAQYWLAWFYANRSCEGTVYFKPQESLTILEQLLVSDVRPRVKESARWLLNDLRQRGHIP